MTTLTIHPSWFNPHPQRRSRYVVPLSIARSSGRCIDCGCAGPDVRGYLPRCDRCRAAWNAARRVAYHERRDSGQCVECGLRPVAPLTSDPGVRGVLCEVCAARHRRSQPNRHRTRYAAAKAAGRCVYCSQAAVPGRIACAMHAERERLRKRAG